MRKPIALALLAALVAIVATVGVARPRAALPTPAREYRLITCTDRSEAIAFLEAAQPDADLERLLHELRHGSSLERARAAREMRKLGPRAAPAIPELVEFLCDAENRWDRVRKLIEDVLVAIGEEAAPAALGLIQQPDKQGRNSGIRVLARIRGPAAVDVLAPLLTDKAVGVRAAWELARLGEPGLRALVAAVRDASVPLKTLEGAVAGCGKPIALPLAALLDSTEQATRERAAAMLVKLGKNARPGADAVLRALADPAFGDRLSLVEVLKSLERVPPGTAIVLADLARSLLHTEAGADVWRIRGMGQGHMSRFGATRFRELAPLRALADLGPAAFAALPTLLEIMASGDPDAGAEAARAYWRIGGDPQLAVEHLVANLTSFPKGGYHPAMSLLCEMGSDAVEAIPTLLRELESKSIQRSHPAAAALAAMGDPGMAAVRAWLPTANPPDPAVLAFEFPDTLRADLIARFGDEVGDVFVMMETPLEDLLPAVAAGDGEDPLGALRRRLHDPSEDKRGLVFVALRSMGEKAAPAIPDLVALLADDGLRAEAASTLGAIGPAAVDAVPALVPYVDDPSHAACSATIESLWLITGDVRYRDMVFCPSELKADDYWAVPRLLKELGTGSASWRRDCAAALGRFGAAARPAAPDLARLAADENEDEYVRDAAREALVKIRG